MYQSGNQPSSAVKPMLQVHGRYSSGVPTGLSNRMRCRYGFRGRAGAESRTPVAHRLCLGQCSPSPTESGQSLVLGTPATLASPTATPRNLFFLKKKNNNKFIRVTLVKTKQVSSEQFYNTVYCPLCVHHPKSCFLLSSYI